LFSDDAFVIFCISNGFEISSWLVMFDLWKATTSKI
jgi:hypothetical protein